MKKNNTVTIRLNNNDITLENDKIQFYLKESNRKIINKNKIEKFFTNLLNVFNKNS